MQKDKKDYDKYENDVIDVDEVIGTDIKINPDYYIHSALLKAQAALMNDTTKEGFTKYWVFIEHIEVLCKAANMLSPKYEEDIKAYKESKEYQKAEPFLKNVKLANKKLGGLMEEVFSKKVATDPLQA